MREGFLAVCWKETAVLRRAYGKISSYVSTLMYVMFFGVFPAWFLREALASSPLVLFYISLAPLVTGAGMATLAFAGERENHTLETLLSTPLGERAILLGKVMVYTIYAWLYALLCLAAGCITASLLARMTVIPDPALIFSALWVGALTALFSTNMGTLASLRSGTVKEAGRKLQLLFMMFVVPYIVINFLPDQARAGLMSALGRVGVVPIALLATVVLAVVNLALIRRAAQRFVRREMILD